MSPAAEPTTAGDSPRPDLKARTLGSMAWTFAGFGVQQVLRLANNYILTRLLHLPRIFGLASVVTIVILGVEMLSDLGLGPAVVHSKRGDDPRFLNTAWLVQISRGFILGAVTAVLAWPVSWIYGEPQLFGLILLAAVSPVIRGFNSSRILALNRKVSLSYLTRLEVVTQVLATITTILFAAWLRSVWALLIGWLTGDAIRMILSHLILPGHRNRIEWDKEAARELINVGRWILLGTAVTYAVGQLDRLTLGRLLSMQELGIYNMAAYITAAVLLVGQTIGRRVLFPMLSETIREDPERLGPRFRKGRLLWVVPTAAALVILAIGGDFVIRILYPPQFWAAGWMLRVLAAGSILAVLNQSYSMIWLALGEFRINTFLMILQLPVLLGAMFAGYALYGLPGFVIGVAAVELIVFPVQTYLIARRRLWQPQLDVPVVAACGGLIALGYWLV